MLPDALAPGALFANDYEIVKPLRTGGMGSIYVARQRSTGKLRALKLMLTQLVADAELRRRFEQEARIASLVESDHVVEVVGAGVDDASGQPWLAMELLEGTDLEAKIEASGPLSLAESNRVFRELCHAVSAAHAAGIIHRDLKPENIFLANARKANETATVKVLDFGIAKIALEATSRNTGAMGSPLWMAPEQSERGALTPAADVWALGLLGFYFLTGKMFWLCAHDPETTVQQVMKEVLFGVIPAASVRAARLGVADRLPEGFDAWFARCVHRDPRARFADAAETYAVFALLAGDHAGAPSRAPLPRASNPPSWKEAAATVPANATLLASSAGARTLVTEPPLEQPKPPLIRPAFAVAAVLALLFTAAAMTYLALHPPNANAQRSPKMATTTAPSASAASLALPPDVAETRAAAWFGRVRGRCNPVEAELAVNGDPPPIGNAGLALAASCFAIAGKLNFARGALMELQESDRAWAAGVVFEVLHPMADAGDSAASLPVMRFVLEFAPDHPMALYHAGLAEYVLVEQGPAKQHLGHFLDLYGEPDQFNATARQILQELERGRARNTNCDAPIAVDPEGRKVLPLGCAAR